MRKVSRCLAAAEATRPGAADMLVVDVLSVKMHARTTMLALLPETCDVLCTHSHVWSRIRQTWMVWPSFSFMSVCACAMLVAVKISALVGKSGLSNGGYDV